MRVNTKDIFDVLREKRRYNLTGGNDFDKSDIFIKNKLDDIFKSAQSYLNTMNKSENRLYLWDDLAFELNNTNGINLILKSYSRLLVLAIAYSTNGTSYYKSTQIKNDLTEALEWLYANHYNPNIYPVKTEGNIGVVPYGNWWIWQIGIPIALNDILCLMYSEIPKDILSKNLNAVFTYCKTPNNVTGANSLWLAKVHIIGGILSKDYAKFENGISVMKREIKYVEIDDGFYKDGSFIQHHIHAYTGGYGVSFIDSLTDILYILCGTKFEIDEKQKKIIKEWFHNSFEPLIYNGYVMDMVCGREISRCYADGFSRGSSLMRNYLLLSYVINPDDRGVIRSRLKYWLKQISDKVVFNNFSLMQTVELNKLLSDESIKPSQELTLHKNYPSMDRCVHLTSSFGFALSMSSSRIGNYECINNENLQGWYTGEGMTYLYNNDFSQYIDNYWSTIDRYRLAGITVDTIKRENGSGQGFMSANAWAGGCTLGNVGINAMLLKAYDSDGNDNSLSAKKSWFMFENEIICVGSDIFNNEGRTVETIIENRKINGDNILLINGEKELSDYGQLKKFNDVKWIHLQGNTMKGSDIGYYFPKAVCINGLRDKRTDSWNSINNYINSTVSKNQKSTRNYMTLWFDHGINPDNERYEYIILPNKSADEVNFFSLNPSIKITENSSVAHAVKNKNTNTLGIIFWADNYTTVDEVTCDKQACVILRENNDSTLAVSVSDPTQANNSEINIEIKKKGQSVISCDPSIKIVRLEPTIRFAVEVENSKGRSFELLIRQ